MKRANLCLTLMAVIAAMVLASCSKAPESVKLLPEETDVIVRLDVKKMLEQSNAANSTALQEKLTALVDGENMGGDLRQLLKKILKDPAKAGIDLREPLYIGLNGDTPLALAGTVLDSDDFEALLTAVAKEGDMKLAEKGEVKYLNSSEATLAFNDAVFTIALQHGGTAVDDILARFDSKANTTLAEDENFLKMEAQSGLAQVLVTGKAIKHALGNDIKQEALPDGAVPEDLALLLNMDASKGKVRIDGITLAGSKAWKDFIDKADDTMDDIDGDAAKYITRNGVAIFANIDGDDYYELVSKQLSKNELGQDGESMASLRRMLTCLDGDIAVGISNVGSHDTPTIAAYAKTKTPALVDEAKNNGLDRAGIFTLGYEQGFSYLLMGNAEPAFTEPQGAFKSSDVKGKHFYAYADVQAVLQAADMFGYRSYRRQIADTVPQWLKTVEVSYEGDGKSNIVVQLTDDSKHPLALLLDALLEVL